MATALDELKVKAFTRDRVPNDYPGGELPWQTYQTVRNALVQTCRQHGPVGPLGVLQIVPGAESLVMMLFENRGAWERGDPDPMYYILDEQPNHERYCYAELNGNDPFNAGWLLSITETLRGFDGWGLGVSNIRDSYVLIFGNRLLVKGRLATCRTASEVVEKAQRLLKCQTASEVDEEEQRLLKRGDKKWWQFWR